VPIEPCGPFWTRQHAQSIKTNREFSVPPAAISAKRLNVSSLELRLFGSLLIHQDGAVVTSLKSKKGQALLCYLAVSGQPWSRPALAGLFWPDMPEANALLNLRKALHLLNRQLAPHLLVSRQAIAFNQTGSTWLDVAEFEARVTRQADVADLQRAVALYRDEFLADLYLPECDVFEEWAAARRVRLRHLALDALARLTEQELQLADYEAAERHARRQVEIDNLRERGHRQLMETLAWRGQRSAALLQYEACRQILATELGVDPAPATAKLAEQIRQNQFGQQTAAAGAAPQPAPSSGAARRQPIATNLLASTTPLVGRDTELAELSGFLAEPAVRLVTLVGPPGIGKSSLALAIAAQERERFPQGVFVVELATVAPAADQLPTSIAELLATRIADAMGYPFADENRERSQQLLDYLRDRAVCLVLDNFEHLLDGANLLAQILKSAPRVTMLVTSRESLRMYEEQVYPVRGLAFSAELAAEEDAAVQLFLQRARRVRPDFALRAADMPHMTTICHLAAGMPLALALAAAQVDGLSLAAIAGELGESLNLLETEWRDVPLRHRSMRAALEASWSQLAGEEQELFSRLSVFHGGFTRPAASKVGAPEMSQPALRRILAALGAKSFLSYETAADRYQIHELLRQFAAEKLALSPELASEVLDRHSSTFCTFLQERSEDWHTARQMEALEAVKPEAENIRRAWERSLLRGEWEQLAQAMDSWRWYHQWRLQIGEFDRVCQAVVRRTDSQAAAETSRATDALRLRAKALTWLGWSAPERSEALRKLDEALNLLARLEGRGHDIRLERALALRERALRLMGGGDLHRAQQDQAQSLALFQALGHPWGIAQSLAGLGLLDWRTGDYEAALEKMQRALAIRQTLGDRRAEAESKHGLGLIYRGRGRLDEAEQLQRQALDLGQRVGDRMALTRYKINLARTLLLQGNQAEAQQLARECLAMGQELSYPLYEGWSRSYLCEILLHGGQYGQARRHAERARFILEEHQTTLRLPDGGNLHLSLGELALVEGSYMQAQAAFRQSQEKRDQSWDRQSSLLALAGLGAAAGRLGQLEAARQHLSAALATALSTQSFPPVVYTLPFVALFLARTGHVERGLALWEAVRTAPFVAHSQWFADVAGRELEALGASAATGAAAAARERSQAADLWEVAAGVLAVLQG
jgi:predicted ATPase/DNA-binding SARP family transcriptional activator/Flp pilus assembly protein TadD